MPELLLDPDAQAHLERLGRPYRYPRGRLLFGEREPSDFAVYLRKGYVKITVGGPNNIVGIRGPGEVVGEMAAIEKQPRTAGVYAMTEVDAVFVPAGEWIDFVRHDWSFTQSVLRLMGMRLREATRKQVELGELAIEQRVAKSLSELAEMIGDREEKGVAVRISQAELAGLAGTTRESISRMLGKIWGDEITLTGRQKIIIRDQGKLAKIASGELILSY